MSKFETEYLNLEAIEKRCEAATEGPWRLEVDSLRDIDLVWSPPIPDAFGTEEIQVAQTNHCASADGKFIAYARTDIPLLIAEVRRLRAVAEAACNLIDSGHGYSGRDYAATWAALRAAGYLKETP